MFPTLFFRSFPPSQYSNHFLFCALNQSVGSKFIQFFYRVPKGTLYCKVKSYNKRPKAQTIEGPPLSKHLTILGRKNSHLTGRNRERQPSAAIDQLNISVRLSFFLSDSLSWYLPQPGHSKPHPSLPSQFLSMLGLSSAHRSLIAK